MSPRNQQQPAAPRGVEASAWQGWPQVLDLGRLLLIVLLAVAVRLPFLAVPMITDEGGYAYVARFWSPAYELYRDIPFDRPQGIFVLYRLCFALFGHGLVAIRLFAAVYTALAAACLVVLARQVLPGRVTGWRAGAVFAVFSAAPFIEGFTANAETFLALPLVLSALLAWRQSWFWSGLVAGLAILIKANGLAAVALALAWGLVVTRSLRPALVVCAGVAAGLAPGLAHGVWIGWSDYWASIYQRRMMVYSSTTAGLQAQWRALSAALSSTASSLLFPLVASFVGGLRLAGRPRQFCLLWLGTSLLGVAMGGWWRQHYFIQLIPPLALLAAEGLRPPEKGSRVWAWSTALATALLFFLATDARLAVADRDQQSWEIYQRPGYLLQDEVSRYLSRSTKPTDTIFVAFAEAEWYYLADRKAAVPQLFFLDIEHSASVFASVVESLAEGRPAMVAVVQGPPPQRMSTAQFSALLARNYQFDRTFLAPPSMNGITIYRLKGRDSTVGRYR